MAIIAVGKDPGRQGSFLVPCKVHIVVKFLCRHTFAMFGRMEISEDRGMKPMPDGHECRRLVAMRLDGGVTYG